MNTLADSGDIAAALGIGDDEDLVDMTATEAPTDDPLQFHVQMNGWTLRQMEALVVEAAARMMVDKLMRGDIGKQVQARTIEMVTERINAKLEPICENIINQPVMIGGKTAGTLADMIGLTANDYLSQIVDSSGKTKAEAGGDSWSFRAEGKRIEWIARRALDVKFKREIEAASNAAVSQAQAAIKAEHAAIIAAEKARIKAALEKAVS